MEEEVTWTGAGFGFYERDGLRREQAGVWVELELQNTIGPGVGDEDRTVGRVDVDGVRIAAGVVNLRRLAKNFAAFANGINRHLVAAIIRREQKPAGSIRRDVNGGGYLLPGLKSLRSVHT